MKQESEVLRILRNGIDRFNRSNTDYVAEIVTIIEHGEREGESLTDFFQTQHRYDCYIGHPPDNPSHPLFKAWEPIHGTYPVRLIVSKTNHELVVESLDALDRELETLLGSVVDAPAS